MISIFSLTQKEFATQLHARLGRGKQHAERLYTAWMRTGKVGKEAWAEPQAFTLIDEMAALIDFTLPEVSAVTEQGETIKFLLKMPDGRETESVIIPMESGLTLCLSSQIGCRMGCAFCETGRMGLIRQLKPAEIVVQLFIARFHFGKNIRNLVFMGMGEPFDNYEAVMRAIDIFTDPQGFGLGPRRITVSTSGKVEEIYRFAKEAPLGLNLAVSVNAPTEALRTKIMPVNRKWNMNALKEALQAYSTHPRRKILVEYVLLKGVNDALSDAEALATYLEGLNVTVNLIPYNPQRIDRFAPPDEQQQELFIHYLREKKYRTFLRTHKGRDIMAACGQLGNKDKLARNPSFRYKDNS